MGEVPAKTLRRRLLFAALGIVGAFMATSWIESGDPAIGFAVVMLIVVGVTFAVLYRRRFGRR